MLNKKFTNFLFIVLLLVPLALAGCDDNDEEEEAEKAALLAKIATAEEQAAALALQVAEDTLTAADLTAYEAAAAVVAAQLALDEAVALAAQELAANKVAGDAAAIVAAQLALDEAVALAAQTELDRVAAELAAIEAVALLEEEAAESLRLAEAAAAADLASHHELDHVAIHEVFNVSETLLTQAIFDQEVVAGDLADAEAAYIQASIVLSAADTSLDLDNTNSVLIAALDSAQHAYDAAQELVGTLETTKADADQVVTDAQAVFDVAEAADILIR